MNRDLPLPGYSGWRVPGSSALLLLAILLAVPAQAADESWREVYVATVGHRTVILDFRLMPGGGVIGYLSDTDVDGTFECRGTVTKDGMFTIDTDLEHPGQGHADAELTIEGKVDRERGMMFTVIRRLGEPHGVSIEMTRVARFVESERRIGGRAYSMVLPHVDRRWTGAADGVNRAIADGVAADMTAFARERLGLDRNGSWMGSDLDVIGSFDLAEAGLVCVSYAAMAYNPGGRPVRRNGEVVLAIDGRRIRRLSFADLFRTDTASLHALARLCIIELWRTRGLDGSRGPYAVQSEPANPTSDVADTATLNRYAAEFVESGYLSGFALTSLGVEFTWFLRDSAPDAVVMIPYSRITPYILPNSALDRFVRSGN